MNETARMHKFTSLTRHVIVLAQQEAERLEHDYIGTEHLLLGLLDEKDGKAAQILTLFHVTSETARQRTQAIFRAQPARRHGTFTIALGRLGAFTVTRSRKVKSRSGGRRLTRRAQKCIHFAVEETERQHAEQIDTHHLLLGILREGEGLACQVLKSLDVDMRTLKTLLHKA